MSRVSTRIELAQTVYEAERFWYDVERWPEWVDQLARVVQVQGPWPEPGAAVRWESVPAGRGEVLERVVEYEPRSGQTTEVEDDSITGRQRVSFIPCDDGVEVAFSLEYRLKRRGPLSALVDLLFIRPAMGRSLVRTLTRFGTEVAAHAEG